MLKQLGRMIYDLKYDATALEDLDGLIENLEEVYTSFRLMIESEEEQEMLRDNLYEEIADLGEEISELYDEIGDLNDTIEDMHQDNIELQEQGE